MKMTVLYCVINNKTGSSSNVARKSRGGGGMATKWGSMGKNADDTKQ